MALARPGLATFAYCALSTWAHLRLARAAHHPRGLTERPFGVTVLVPTLNEEGYVVDTLRSLREQRLKLSKNHALEILLVDSESDDATVEHARPLVDRVVNAPRGKLTALTLGVHAARGDVIVEADADGVYPPYFLHEITRPFLDDTVVGTHAPVAYMDSPVSFAVNAALEPLNHLLGKFPGGSRAYRRSAFNAVAGFNQNVDQTHLPSLWREEEFAFPARLRRAGRVVFHPEAICFKSARRFDPVFVRDDRARRFREEARTGKRFAVRA